MSLPIAPNPIHLTPKAAEQVVKVMSDNNLDGFSLRIGLVGGGCSGFQYLLNFDNIVCDDDFVSNEDGVQIVVDPFSAQHLMGTTIDFVDQLNESKFKFENPNSVKTCGCGSSFST